MFFINVIYKLLFHNNNDDDNDNKIYLQYKINILYLIYQSNFLSPQAVSPHPTAVVLPKTSTLSLTFLLTFPFFESFLETIHLLVPRTLSSSSVGGRFKNT